MVVAYQEKLKKLVGLIEDISIDPDVNVDYFIPGVAVTAEGGKGESGGPYIQFSYESGGQHVQHMPLTQSYLEKTPEDLVNLFTFSLERFKEEIDSRQYGAQ